MEYEEIRTDGEKTPSILPVYVGRPADVREPIEEATYDLLDSLGISYERCDHAPAATNDSCAAPEAALGLELCKNLFLRNRRKTQYYMLMMPGSKRLISKNLSKAIGESRLSFGSRDAMKEMLGVTPGSVSVLSLMNDTENRVKLLVDEDLFKDNDLGIHPCLNTSSLKVKAKDIWDTFLPAVGHEKTLVTLSDSEE